MSFLRRKGTDLVITGVPRSGTSYLTSCLHKLENCVAINEPEEIFQHLDDTGAPWGMADYYRSLRADIAAKKPICNKLRNGNVIEDTAVVDEEQFYTPDIQNRSFMLATKNTLGYLARLPYLAQALPQASLIACLRDPHCTIASWKSTFPHLCNASVDTFRKGFRGDQLMSEPARHRLDEIAQTADKELRRAFLWRHLVLLIHESRHLFAKILRYEELVRAPEEQLRSFLAGVPSAPHFKLCQPLPASSPRTARADNLTPKEAALITEVCADAARLFGYDLVAPIANRHA